MKKLLFSFMLFFPLGIFAQTSEPTITSTTIEDYSPENKFYSSVNFHNYTNSDFGGFGIELGYISNMSKNLFYTLGIGWSANSLETSTYTRGQGSTTVKQNYHDLYVPARLGVSTNTKSFFSLQASAGAFVNYTFSGEYKVKIPGQEEIKSKLSKWEDYDRLGLGIIAGVALNIHAFQLGFDYSIGLAGHEEKKNACWFKLTFKDL